MNATEIHARLETMRPRYDALTDEELIAMRQGMTENYVYTITTIERGGIEKHERAMDALTMIRTLLTERGVE